MLTAWRRLRRRCSAVQPITRSRSASFQELAPKPSNATSRSLYSAFGGPTAGCTPSSGGVLCIRSSSWTLRHALEQSQRVVGPAHARADGWPVADPSTPSVRSVPGAGPGQLRGWQGDPAIGLQTQQGHTATHFAQMPIHTAPVQRLTNPLRQGVRRLARIVSYLSDTPCTVSGCASSTPCALVGQYP